MPTDLSPSLIPYFGCVLKNSADGLCLIGAVNHMNAAAITCEAYEAPFTLTAVAKTDSTNLRLYWHAGEIIFNWECSVRELRIHHPRTGEQWGIKDQGFLSADQWHEVVWEVKPDLMRLLVDGELRFEMKDDFRMIRSALGIGPCFGSTVTVRSFSVEAK
jgi:hypothetical protein